MHHREVGGPQIGPLLVVVWCSSLVGSVLHLLQIHMQQKEVVV